MNDFVCPECKSSDLALNSAVYAQGSTTTQYQANSTTTYSHPDGGLAFGTVSGSATSMSGLAAQCAPPRKPPVGMGILLMASAILVPWFLLYRIVNLQWKDDSFDDGVALVASILVLIGLAVEWNARKQMPKYRAALALYPRRCVCLRCGAGAILPVDWKNRLSTPKQ